MVTGPGSILAVMAHPDDAELWAGGTLALHARHQEAVIAVEKVHKGVHGKKEVVIRFPSSQDVMWRRSSKFHPGQAGEQTVGERVIVEVKGSPADDARDDADMLPSQ